MTKNIHTDQYFQKISSNLPFSEESGQRTPFFSSVKNIQNIFFQLLWYFKGLSESNHLKLFYKESILRLCRIILFTSVMIIFIEGKGAGTVTSVTLTPDTPTTLSNTLGYYLAGITYSFDVHVIDPDIAGWGEMTDVRITIPNLTDIVVAINPSGTGAQTINTNTGPVDASATIGGSDTYNDFTVTFSITIRWDTAESAWAALRNTVASATSTNPILNTDTDTVNVSYGVCSSIKILNFVQDGDAADGMINPYNSDSGFSVSGDVVYNVPGASVSDRINDVNLGECTSTDLLLDGGATVFSNVGDADEPDFTIDSVDATLVTLGNHTWRVRSTMTTAGGPEDSINSLAISTDRVLVTGLSVSQGDGRDVGNYHWRSLLVPGTVFTVTARMQNSGGGMVGNTTFTVDYNDGTEFDITIPNGSTNASVIIPSASIPPEGSGNTNSYTYYVSHITNNSHGEQGDGTFGANLSQIIDSSYPAAPYSYYDPQYIWWENGDPPPNQPTSALTRQREVTSATSISVYWDPIDTSTGSADGDFYEYRIYFREANTGDPYLQWDGDDDDTLRDSSDTITNNPWPAPTSDSNLNFDSNGWKYTSIPNLKIYTQYEYYITAVDLFGNETPAPSAPYATRTQPFSIEIGLSDGITSYTNDSFTDLTPTLRPLRETNIKVEINIVTSEELPDTVKVWFASGDINTSPDIISSTNTVNQGAFSQNTLFSSTAQKIGSNQWVAYLPTTAPIIRYGNSIRFIVEAISDSISAFSDSEIEPYPNQNPNDDEWTFYIGFQPTFRPWPARILNNVITNRTPLAYPAYFLSNDAFVTITVYDIKGRPVATLLDNAYRLGGQNIKEQGWRGTNKNHRKLGVGLYYIHFKAKRASDGRVILNKMKKVVIAK